MMREFKKTRYYLRLFCFFSPLLSSVLLFSSCSDSEKPPDEKINSRLKKENNQTVFREDFKKMYDSAGVTGCFVLYDEQKDQWLFCDSAACSKRYLPASTFKICNSLIAMESGAVKDENEILKWDGKKRRMDSWNADTDMKNAFKNSTVWFYQETARRTGGKKMKTVLDILNFGNADTSGGIDKFWLSGGLKISPIEQINFLRNLKNNKLPFSQRNIDIVKKIMISEDSSAYTLRSKTGWGFVGGTEVGWYVGYLEKNSVTYFFANFVQCADTANENFGKCRKEITKKILSELKLF